jgi:membrane associated rhomboid family serine protease
MLPLRDELPTRTFPLVTVALIVANLGVWIVYQLPRLEESFEQLGFRPCEVVASCPTIGPPWPVDGVSSMFAHGSWEHLIFNMLFLWIFGNNVEDALGRLRFLVFYLLCGFAADALQSWVTLQFGTAEEATIPNVGASGAIAGVLGAYLVLHPRAKVLTWVFPVFFFRLTAWVYLGIWFLFQAWDGSWSLTHPAEAGGIAYFAHVGGFLFGMLAVRVLMVGRPPQLPHQLEPGMIR